MCNMSVSGLGMLINKARFLPITTTVFSADYKPKSYLYSQSLINQCTRITEESLKYSLSVKTITCCAQVDRAKWYVQFLLYLCNMLPAIGE